MQLDELRQQTEMIDVLLESISLAFRLSSGAHEVPAGIFGTDLLQRVDSTIVFAEIAEPALYRARSKWQALMRLPQN